MTGAAPPRLEVLLLDGDRLVVSAGERRVVHDADLLDVLTGDADRSVGDVRVDGLRLGPGTAARARHGVVAIADAPVAAEVAVVDHLAARVGIATAREAVAGCPLLADRGDDPAGVLSGGERRALAWLRAVVLEPRVVVLRDATVGLDGPTIRWTEQLVAAWLDGGAAVVESAVGVTGGRASR